MSGVQVMAHDTWLRRVLFFGDSFVAGVGDPTGLGWVGRVVAASFAAGHPLTAYNLGVRMDTSLDLGERWLAEARPRLLAGTAPRVVLSFGANDTTAAGDGTRVAPERCAAALTAMLREASDHGLPALVVGPPPAGGDDQHARIRALSADLAAVCAAHRAPFVAVADRLGADSNWVREARHRDGSHPGAAGYAELADLVLAAGFIDWLAG